MPVRFRPGPPAWRRHVLKFWACAAFAGAIAASAHAATCPTTCVTFDDEAEAERFVTMVATAPAPDVRAFLKQEIARHAAHVIPDGTQFVLLAEHKVPAAKSAFYGIQLPGAGDTKYLVAVK